MTKKTDKEQKINNKKDIAYSGIFSVLSVWASAIYVVADILLEDLWAAVVSLIIMVGIIVVSKIASTVIGKELSVDHKSKKVKKWIQNIQKQSSIAGYTGIIVLVISFLVNIYKLNTT
jgi:hypothetical protein